MIKAVIFDLDGTLVQTEKIKAQAYAEAVQKLRHLAQPDSQAIDAYREIVGAARDVASRHVMEKLRLEKELRPLMDKYRVSQPWEVLTAMRVAIYSRTIANPETIRQNRWPYTLDLLGIAKEQACLTGLATVSRRSEALQILRALDIEYLFNVIVASEDVKNFKPDPEIYLLAAQRLNVSPAECLVIEDSPNGVQSAAAAGMQVVALATPFTFYGLHSRKIYQTLEHDRIVHRPEKLVETVRRFFKGQFQPIGRTGKR